MILVCNRITLYFSLSLSLLHCGAVFRLVEKMVVTVMFAAGPHCWFTFALLLPAQWLSHDAMQQRMGLN